MITKSQKNLVYAFLLSLEERTQPLYQELITSLLEVGYREKSAIAFKHSQHNKQIAKMGVKSKKGQPDMPYFALRFSACNGYSQRFSDIVAAAIARYPSRTPKCKSGACHYCAGAPDTHVYRHLSADGERLFHCGAYVLEIPDMGPDVLQEIKAMILEEHAYLMQHEAEGLQ